jgi:magnesium chelatase subunit I
MASSTELLQLKTLGDLKRVGYTTKPIKVELRDNLIRNLQNHQNVFAGIWGYEDTVIPEIERAILSMHHINLLGLRGQAKTRIARMMTRLLDEYIPVVAGSELNDDPFAPLSRYSRDLIAEMGDETPITWWHRDDRYTEKLATPDVSVADLIGDVDPIKAANLKLPYSDERVLHYGLIPRSHRGIFVINELPDLQARIQVALFNILQEGDIQIRGFKLRLPLDVQIVFTANPEDYTNRGSIVTPLKDRIDSQIITHYPKNIETSRKITEQEANLPTAQKKLVNFNELAHVMVEQIAFEARQSPYVDAKSGVSARLTISAFQNIMSSAERRALINGETHTHVRVADFWGAVPAITGKVELVYEGEQEGAHAVAQHLIGKMIRSLFLQYFPDPEKMKKMKDKKNPYKVITNWFGDGKTVDILQNMSYKEYQKILFEVAGLNDLVEDYHANESYDLKLFLMEFALHGLAEYSMLSRNVLSNGLEFKDLLDSMLNIKMDFEDEDL